MDADTEQKQQTRPSDPAREQFLEAMLGLRRLVDATLAKYQDAGEGRAILTALNDASAASKSKVKYKLGPSRNFLTAVQRLEKAEAIGLLGHHPVPPRGGRLIVDAMLNGKLAVPMVYDTGASEVIISTALADELGMKPTDSDPVVKHRIADGSIVEARNMTLSSVRVGKVIVKDVVCSVMPGDKTQVPTARPGVLEPGRSQDDERRPPGRRQGRAGRAGREPRAHHRTNQATAKAGSGSVSPGERPGNPRPRKSPIPGRPSPPPSKSIGRAPTAPHWFDLRSPASCRPCSRCLPFLLASAAAMETSMPNPDCERRQAGVGDVAVRCSTCTGRFEVARATSSVRR